MRTVDPVAHASRRDAFLDAAESLIQTKGYARFSIQDVLDEVSVSKGAFYHYFDSKADLLEGVLPRMINAGVVSLEPAVADPDLSALEKFQAVYSGLAKFKAEHRELILGFMRVWLSDENVIVREKYRRGVIARMTPLMATIIRQGVAEGTFTATDPDAVARVFMALFMGANEAAMDLYSAYQDGTITIEEVDRTLAAFGDGFEGILGVRPGALGFADRSALIREWFVAATPAARGDSA